MTRINPQIAFKNDKAPVKENPYTKDDMPLGKHVRRFHWIHYIWKYKIFVPFFKLARKFWYKTGNVRQEEITDSQFNDIERVFDKAFDKAIDKWIYHYICLQGKAKNREPTLEYINKYKEGYNVQLLETAKDVVKTYIHWDTAYKEWFIMFLDELTVEFNKMKLRHNNQHIMYTSTSLYDMNFFTAQDYKVWMDGKVGYIMKVLSLVEGKIDHLQKNNKRKTKEYYKIRGEIYGRAIKSLQSVFYNLDQETQKEDYRNLEGYYEEHRR